MPASHLEMSSSIPQVNATEVNATEVNATEANATEANDTEANATEANATEANDTVANAIQVIYGIIRKISVICLQSLRQSNTDIMLFFEVLLVAKAQLINANSDNETVKSLANTIIYSLVTIIAVIWAAYNIIRTYRSL